MNYFDKYFLSVISKEFFCFEGVADRKKFWYFFIFSLIIGIILNFLPLLIYIYAFAIVLPSLGLAARRLNDAGFSPLFLLLCLFPVLGPLAVLIMCAMPTKQQPQA